MIKVAITSPWQGQDSEYFSEVWRKHTPNNSGVWKNICFHNNPYDADWIIGWETLDPQLNLESVDKSKIILLGREPPWMLPPQYDNWNSFTGIKYKFKHALNNSYLVSNWSSNISYDDMKKVDWEPRDKSVCVITTDKNWCSGHKARLNFIREFCHKYPHKLDIYGNGMKDWCNNNGLGDHYKGCSVYRDDTAKHDWLSQYNYCLALENGQLNGLFTEKFNDPIMALTKPIYWGAQDLFKFFPKNSFTHLDINSEKSCEDLLNLIKKPITEKDIAAMKKSRMLIMDFYAVLPSIKRIIETGKILPF